MYKTLTTLIASNILLDLLIQAIIVERNLHTYYRVSTTTVKTCNDSDHYYILQCPFQSSVNIPKPKDMPVCLIVGRYSENEEKQKELVKPKPRTNLNTHVDYRYLKPPKLVKLVKIKNGKPYTMLLKPVEKKKVAYKKPPTNIKQSVKTSSVKLMLAKPDTSINQTSSVLYSIPLIQKVLVNDSVALASTNHAQKSIETVKPSVTSEINLHNDSLKEADGPQATTSPLKYLTVQDTVKKLQLLSPLTSNQTQLYKSEKFFTDLHNHKKGFRSKGYQNMYHRDEIYQDHIFYDDLQQEGNYRIKQKLQPK